MGWSAQEGSEEGSRGQMLFYLGKKKQNQRVEEGMGLFQLSIPQHSLSLRDVRAGTQTAQELGGRG